jgi:hypothetical protein
MDASSMAESLFHGCCRDCWQRHKHSCEARSFVFLQGLAGSIYHGADSLPICYENQFGGKQLCVGPALTTIAALRLTRSLARRTIKKTIT